MAGRESIRVLRLVVSTTLRADARLTFAVIGLRVAAGVLTPLDAVALGLLLDAAVEGNTAGALTYAALFAVCDAGSSALNHPAGQLELTLREKTDFLVDSRLLRAATRPVGTRHLESPDYLDQVERVRDQFSSLGALVERLVALVQVVIMSVVTVVALAGVHWSLSLLIFAAVPTVMAAGRAESLRLSSEDGIAEHVRFSDRVFDLGTRPEHAKEVRLLGLGGHLTERFLHGTRRITGVRDRTERRATAWTMAGWLFFTAGFLGGLAVLVRGAAQGTVTVGQALIVLSLAIRLNEQVNEITTAVAGMRRMMADGRRFLRVLERIGDGREGPPAEAPPALPPTMRRGIALHGVSFGYPGAEKPVLRDVDLVLEPGTTVALVGENGAGKSTLVKLLCRMYEPDSGRITVDGQDLRDVPAEQWRDALSACFQDFVAFELLARETIGVGRLAAIDDEEHVRQAAHTADATAVLQRLPEGLETQLGERWDAGVGLSVGQWQRIAMARAAMRTAPQLLVLDEPSASLDAATEHALFERFTEASAAGSRRGAVTLLVSHRFSTVRMADRIVVLDDGRIAEHGSHEELMARGGTYAQLFTLQAKGYA
ncbi:ABC transporter ATP-binding protein [Streptomyces sulphureus]|uniref:ABC transporter ATP-binding protein n=1 Tax=Streptomyces sulphureus TaxID=47758 RepID=UPI00037059FD|nr:ABC transporter ATP-binding protein [Streptomyces sulphureus]